MNQTQGIDMRHRQGLEVQNQEVQRLGFVLGILMKLQGNLKRWEEGQGLMPKCRLFGTF